MELKNMEEWLQHGDRFVISLAFCMICGIRLLRRVISVFKLLRVVRITGY